MGETPAKEEREAGGQSFLARWRAQLPGVAASLTTAFILWLVSLSYEPARRFVYGKPAIDYPLFCTADAVPGPNGGRRVEFYVVNRSDETLTGAQLRQRLDRALGGSGRGSAAILLKADDVRRVGPLRSDDQFNGDKDDKGRLILRKTADGVEVTIERISKRSILRGLIDLPDYSAEVTRSPREAHVPFEISDLYESCYTLK